MGGSFCVQLKEVSFCNPVSDFHRNVAKRTETFLKRVLKFQVDRTCFQGEEERGSKGWKVEKRRRRKGKKE